MANAQPKASWMSPGAPRVAKPSWIRVPAFVDPPAPVPRPMSVPPVAILPSVPPPRSARPSVPPPSSRRHAPIIQSTREVELEGEVAALHTELQRAIHECEHMQARVMEESEPAIVALALAIARRVVGRELATDPALVQHWIREAQGTLPEGAVYVAPDVVVDADLGARVDPSLPAGSAQLREGASTVEISADSRVAAIADALGVDS